MTRAVLGLDLGGTSVKAGVATSHGHVLVSVVLPSGEAGGTKAWLEVGLRAARSALDQSPIRPVAIGLAVPGAVDHGTRLVDLVDRLPLAEPVDLATAYGELNLPVFADNDARAALLAERRWGIRPHCPDLVLFTVGTGLGGAAVVAGAFPGGDPVHAGCQLGHLTIDLDGDPCVCGNRGCAETVASGTALLKAARRAGMQVRDAAGVFLAETNADPRATPVIDRFIRGLSAAVVNAIHAHQPVAVILTGGVMAAGERILAPVRTMIAAHAWTSPRGRVAVEASALGSGGPVLAGAAVALGAADA